MISDYCIQRKIRYTRYADDLSFSGDFDEKELFDKVNGIIEKMNFKINTAKTKLMMPGNRQTVTSRNLELTNIGSTEKLTKVTF
mgnify:CR=1 FL=1